jgi:hypothetical protein
MIVEMRASGRGRYRSAVGIRESNKGRSGKRRRRKLERGG